MAIIYSAWRWLNEFGKSNSRIKKKQNLSQEQLAEKVGVARQTISKWETGETAPDIKQAQILSQIFDVNLDELVGNDTKHSNRNEYNCEKRRCVPWRKNIIISVAVLFICLSIVSLFGVIKRSQILHPEGLEKMSLLQEKVLCELEITARKRLCSAKKTSLW